MTREQIKQIVRLTESIVNKRLAENGARYDDTLLHKANDYIANVGDVTASQLAKYLKVDINTASSILRDMTTNESSNLKLREDGYDQYGDPIQRNNGGSLYTFYIKNPSVKAKIKAHGRWQNVVDERNGKYVINSSHIDDFTDFIRDNGYDLGTDIIFESKNNKRLTEIRSSRRTDRKLNENLLTMADKANLTDYWPQKDIQNFEKVLLGISKNGSQRQYGRVHDITQFFMELSDENEAGLKDWLRLNGLEIMYQSSGGIVITSKDYNRY